MIRFEITGCATDIYRLDQIQRAIRESGGFRINARHAFGWANQPKVCTFAARDQEQAQRIADAALVRLGYKSGPLGLHPYPIVESKS